MMRINRFCVVSVQKRSPMTGFMAAMCWYWGSPYPDERRGGFQRPLIRHHLVLGGLPPEVFDRIAEFTRDPYSFKSPNGFSAVNLVFVLKNECVDQGNSRRRWQYNELGREGRIVD